MNSGMKNGGMPPTLSGDSIGAGEHDEDARRRFRRSDIDVLDHRVRVRRQHRHAKALPGQRKIGDILAGAGGKALIFDAADGLSDAEFRHDPFSHRRTDAFPSAAGTAWFKHRSRRRP